MKKFENLQQKPDLSGEALITIGGVVVQAFETLDHYNDDALESFVKQAKDIPGADRIDVSYVALHIMKRTETLEVRSLDNQNHLSAKGLKNYQKLLGMLGREVVTA